MQITYYGHASFLVQTQGKKLLFDPFISPNELAGSIDVDAIKPDYILLSHGHQDHVADVERIYKTSQPQLISSFEVVSWFEEKGLDNYHPMNLGGEWKFDFGKLKMVNAVHSSSLPDGSHGGNPAGFVITNEEATFYYAGDTALTWDMKLIAEEFSLDFAFLPVGNNFTMGINDASVAAEFVKTKKVIGMHYDTFPYIKIDHDEARETFNKKGLELILMGIGETTNI